MTYKMLIKFLNTSPVLKASRLIYQNSRPQENVRSTTEQSLGEKENASLPSKAELIKRISGIRDKVARLFQDAKNDAILKSLSTSLKTRIDQLTNDLNDQTNKYEHLKQAEQLKLISRIAPISARATIRMQLYNSIKEARTSHKNGLTNESIKTCVQSLNKLLEGVPENASPPASMKDDILQLSKYLYASDKAVSITDQFAIGYNSPKHGPYTFAHIRSGQYLFATDTLQSRGLLQVYDITNPGKGWRFLDLHRPKDRLIPAKGNLVPGNEAAAIKAAIKRLKIEGTSINEKLDTICNKSREALNKKGGLSYLKSKISTNTLKTSITGHYKPEIDRLTRYNKDNFEDLKNLMFGTSANKQLMDTYSDTDTYDQWLGYTSKLKNPGDISSILSCIREKQYPNFLSPEPKSPKFCVIENKVYNQGDRISIKWDRTKIPNGSTIRYKLNGKLWQGCDTKNDITDYIPQKQYKRNPILMVEIFDPKTGKLMVNIERIKINGVREGSSSYTSPSYKQKNVEGSALDGTQPKNKAKEVAKVQKQQKEKIERENKSKELLVKHFGLERYSDKITIDQKKVAYTYNNTKINFSIDQTQNITTIKGLDLNKNLQFRSNDETEKSYIRMLFETGDISETLKLRALLDKNQRDSLDKVIKTGVYDLGSDLSKIQKVLEARNTKEYKESLDKTPDKKEINISRYKKMLKRWEYLESTNKKDSDSFIIGSVISSTFEPVFPKHIGIYQKDIESIINDKPFLEYKTHLSNVKQNLLLIDNNLKKNKPYQAKQIYNNNKQSFAKVAEIIRAVVQNLDAPNSSITIKPISNQATEINSILKKIPKPLKEFIKQNSSDIELVGSDIDNLTLKYKGLVISKAKDSKFSIKGEYKIGNEKIDVDIKEIETNSLTDKTSLIKKLDSLKDIVKTGVSSIKIDNTGLEIKYSSPKGTVITSNNLENYTIKDTDTDTDITEQTTNLNDITTKLQKLITKENTALAKTLLPDLFDEDTEIKRVAYQSKNVGGGGGGGSSEGGAKNDEKTEDKHNGPVTIDFKINGKQYQLSGQVKKGVFEYPIKLKNNNEILPDINKKDNLIDINELLSTKKPILNYKAYKLLRSKNEEVGAMFAENIDSLETKSVDGNTIIINKNKKTHTIKLDNNTFTYSQNLNDQTDNITNTKLKAIFEEYLGNKKEKEEEEEENKNEKYISNSILNRIANTDKRIKEKTNPNKRGSESKTYKITQRLESTSESENDYVLTEKEDILSTIKKDNFIKYLKYETSEQLPRTIQIGTCTKDKIVLIQPTNCTLTNFSDKTVDIKEGKQTLNGVSKKILKENLNNVTQQNNLIATIKNKYAKKIIGKNQFPQNAKLDIQNNSIELQNNLKVSLKDGKYNIEYINKENVYKIYGLASTQFSQIKNYLENPTKIIKASLQIKATKNKRINFQIGKFNVQQKDNNFHYIFTKDNLKIEYNNNKLIDNILKNPNKIVSIISKTDFPNINISENNIKEIKHTPSYSQYIMSNPQDIKISIIKTNNKKLYTIIYDGNPIKSNIDSNEFTKIFKSINSIKTTKKVNLKIKNIIKKN